MKRIRKNCISLFLVVFLLLPALPVVAGEETCVKVGYIEGYGIQHKGDHWEGYGVEYLNQLSKYTNFSYTYVAGGWVENLQRLEAGEIDIILPMGKLQWAEEQFLYAEKEMGFEYIGLYASATDETMFFDDFAHFEGMKVGAFNVNESFESYKEKHGFTADYVFYDDIEEMLAAVKRGEIDAYVLESTAQYEGVKMIAKLDVLPIFIVGGKDNTALMEKINDGISEIRRQNIYFTAKLHDAYYGKDLIGAPAFSYDETQFIEGQTEIKIAFDPAMYATERYHEESGKYVGVLPDLVRLVAEKSGLTITFVPVESYDQAKELFARGEIDAMTSMNHVEDALICRHTDTIFDLPMVFVVKKDNTFRGGDQIGYIRKYEENLPLFQEQFPSLYFVGYETSAALFEAMGQGEVEAGLVNSFSFNMAKALGDTVDMDFFSSANIALDVRLLVSPTTDPLFVSIFNKGLQRTSGEEINAIIMENTATPEVKISIPRIIKQYLFQIIAAAFVLLSLFLSCILHTTHKNRNRLYQLAYIDPLTGRGNYHKFKLDAVRLLEKNQGSGYRITKFDVDRFKVFNELFGRERGDALLKTISDCLAEICNGQPEVFARVAADEFILLRCCKEGEDLHCQRESFEKRLGEALRVSYDIRLFYGHYRIGLGENNIDTLYEKVNFAHRAAKEKSAAGLRACAYDDSLMDDMLRQKELENTMEVALANHEFLVYLQPKYILLDEKVGGAEALVRWQPVNKHMIYPDSFIPLFEQNGFVTHLDLYMFEQVCVHLKRWRSMGKTLPQISVNFSRLHLNDPLFVTKLCGIADQYEIPHSLLEVELTESVLFDGEKTMVLVLAKLHEAGFTLSMDDFGSGYSSLGMLKSLPVDVIKLDRSFFLYAQDNKKAFAVLSHMVNMAKDMEIRTVAEGVELKEHVDLLRDIGCDMVQGYYFAKPMPVEAFEQLL